MLVVKVDTSEGQSLLTEFFENFPVLVEVIFYRMGTSPDWHIVDSKEEFEELVARYSEGVHFVLMDLSSITPPDGSIHVKR